MAAMPLAQSGLLADAMKFTGAESVEPFVGDVTVTTGVVAKAVWPRVENPANSRRDRARPVQRIRILGNAASGRDDLATMRAPESWRNR
jgi:hypothetical protein